jgi:general secretion pathway protein L
MRVLLNWWFSQLAGLLPDFVTRSSARPADAAILDVVGETLTLLTRTRGVTTSIAQSRIDEAGLRDLAQVMRAERGMPSLLVLRVPREVVLRKHLTLPIAARRELGHLLGFEIDRETPFARNEIYWSYAVGRQDPAHGRLDVELFIVPRRSADSLIELARRAGLMPAAIEVDSDTADAIRIPLDDETQGVRPYVARPLIPLTAAGCVLALAAIVAPFLYQEWSIVSADATIASLQGEAAEAAALRRSSDQLSRTVDFFKKENQRHGSALATLAAVTRSLPDDSYLTGLTLRGNRLTLSGLSPAAADLVGLFARSLLFREPSFDSPVVESEGGDLETFTISVSLAQAGTP